MAPDADQPTDLDDVLFECLGEYGQRRDAGEAVDPAVFRERLAGQYERFVSMIEAEGRFADVIEHGAPQVALPQVRPSRYSRFKPVGEGGMGLVYWAVDNTLNREVAFKVIKPRRRGESEPTPSGPLELTQPPEDTPASKAFETLRQRFLQEAWVTSGMTHPGIVPVYELGETPQGVPYYTMRFVKGERTLTAAIKEAKGKDVEERLALLEPFLKVCDTIRYAHTRGVVHRDLKPQNIALGEFGEVVVLDWGLAKLDKEQDLTQSLWQDRVQEYRTATDLRTVTAALGTPGYMSPEAAKGDVNAVDERSDVYSLGVILFEILTGKMPFTFDSYGHFVRQLLGEAAPRADELEPTVPEDLGDLCAAALAREQDARLDSVGQLAREIRAWQSRSAAEREIEALLHDVKSALESAEQLSGEARLTQVDRAASALEQVVKRAPDNTAATRHAERIAALREEGMRERERASGRRLLVRVGVAALVVASLAAVFVALAIDEQRREAETAKEEATHALAAERRAVADAEAARALAQTERDEKSRALSKVLRFTDARRSKELEAQAKAFDSVNPGLHDKAAAWLAAANPILGRKGDHEEALRALEGRAGSQEQQGVLTELIVQLERLATVHAGVKRRHELAVRIREVMEDHAGARADAPKGVGKLPWRLVPLGPDPDSKLSEFAFAGSGRIPKRDPGTGRLVLTDDAALVLVLLPELPDSRPFFVSKYEMTQAQWRTLSWGETPSRFPGDRRPVDSVGWETCGSVLGQHGLALPYWAEWQYACRAGTTTPWWTGEDPKRLQAAAWIKENSGGTTHRVGERSANAFGLHDVHGNVAEWISMRRVSLGGSCSDPADTARSDRGGRAELHGVRPVLRMWADDESSDLVSIRPLHDAVEIMDRVLAAVSRAGGAVHVDEVAATERRVRLMVIAQGGRAEAGKALDRVRAELEQAPVLSGMAFDATRVVDPGTRSMLRSGAVRQFFTLKHAEVVRAEIRLPRTPRDIPASRIERVTSASNLRTTNTGAEHADPHRGLGHVTVTREFTYADTTLKKFRALLEAIRQTTGATVIEVRWKLLDAKHRATLKDPEAIRKPVIKVAVRYPM